MDHSWNKLTRTTASANAFVLPGGKVFVFTGLLNLVGNEDALAAVLGHEIAHQAASHDAERMSQAYVANLALGSGFFLVGMLPGLALFALWNLAGGYFVPDLVYSLPMSRTHEYEADHIGLMMMAEACYDPRSAIPFWKKMGVLAREQGGGEEFPEMLSTHPSVRFFLFFSLSSCRLLCAENASIRPRKLSGCYWYRDLTDTH